jgi:hypothetical protein
MDLWASLTAACNAVTAVCQWRIAEGKINQLNQDHKDDDEIKRLSDLAASDHINAPAYIAAAQLLTARKAQRHGLQQISPL